MPTSPRRITRCPHQNGGEVQAESGAIRILEQHQSHASQTSANDTAPRARSCLRCHFYVIVDGVLHRCSPTQDDDRRGLRVALEIKDDPFTPIFRKL